MKRPRIGITCRYQMRTAPGGGEVPDVSLDARFNDLIMAYGGIPYLIPHAPSAELLAECLEPIDAVIVTGGPDISPGRYGAAPHAQTTTMHPRRESTDFRVLEWSERRGLPLLAICLGIQEWNVSRGGTLHQHVPDLHLQPAVAHREGSSFVFHPVQAAEGSLLHAIIGTERFEVYSSHHQAIDQVGANLVPVAWSDDGLIEALQDPRHRFALGIQWHPEDTPEDPLQRKIFQALVEAAKG